MAIAAAIVTIEMLKKNFDFKIIMRAYLCTVLKKKLYLIPTCYYTLIKIRLYTLVLKYVRYYSKTIINVKLSFRVGVYRVNFLACLPYFYAEIIYIF